MFFFRYFFIFILTLTANNGKSKYFFENVWYFRDFKFSALTTKNTRDFFCFNLFSYWKYFTIILKLFSYLLGENNIAKTNSLLPRSIKSINPVQTYSPIIESHGCINFVSYDFFSFFYSVFFSKAFQVACMIRCTSVITIHITYLSNYFPLIYTYQDLLYMTNPLV